MLKYIGKRILQAIPLLFVITVICFTLINLAPYDAVDSIITPDMTQEEIEECLSKLPTEVAIPEWIDTKDEDAVSDWLSEEYEYCHYGFEICSDI